MAIYFKAFFLLLWCSVICAFADDTPFKRHALSRIRKPSIQSILLSSGSKSTHGNSAKFRSIQGMWMPPRVKVFHDTLKDESKFCSYDRYDNTANVTDLRGGTQTCKKVTTMDYWGGTYVYQRKLHNLIHVIVPQLVSDLEAHTLVKHISGHSTRFDVQSTHICPEFVIPENHKTEGVSDADIVIYISASPFPKDYPFSRVWAHTCRAGKDQPIFLAVNYDPEYILHSGMEEYSFVAVQKALRIHPCTDGGRALIWSNGEMSEMHFHGKCVKVGCEHDDDDKEKGVQYMNKNKWTQCVTEGMKKTYYDPSLFPCPQISEFCHNGKKRW